MHFPPKPSKKKDDEDFERFAEMIRPIFLRMCLSDMLKVNPYAKYMKDIITNKRKIPEAEISTMLANYKSDQAVLGRQQWAPTPWLTERHGYGPTCI